MYEAGSPMFYRFVGLGVILGVWAEGLGPPVC